MTGEVDIAVRNLADASAEIVRLRRDVNEGIEVVHDLSVVNERLQKRVEELEADLRQERALITSITREAGYARAEAVEQRKRAEEAEAKAGELSLLYRGAISEQRNIDDL